MISRKILFYLMSEKGYRVLKYLIESNFIDNIGKVIVGKDSNVLNDFSKEISALCKNNSIDYYNRKDTFLINEEYSIAISWRWLILEKNSKLIVLHDSLLPKYRGFAPLVNALLNFENEVGVTALFANKEFDKGDIICQSKTKIEYPIKIKKAIELISNNYEELIKSILIKINTNKELVANKQNENEATYSLWRDEEDYLIDWKLPVNEIINQINVLSNPYKGASSFLNGIGRVRILDAEIYNSNIRFESKNNYGKTIFLENGNPIIICNNGLVKITRLTSDSTGKTLLPLKNLRIRFKSHKN